MEKFLTNKRHEFTQALIEIEPYKVIAPFGFNVPQLKEKPLQVIVQEPEKQPLFPWVWNIRYCKQVHAKIAIGKKGMIIGSWNFSENSTRRMHEAAVKFDYVAPEVEAFFDEIWGRNK